MKGEAPKKPPIAIPTWVRWTEHDLLYPCSWTDQLHDSFTDLGLELFGVGHFPHRAAPERTADAIASFFRPGLRLTTLL